jgi:hypothetical protein
LFVNAAIEGVEEGTQHLPWLLEIELPQNKDAPYGISKADTNARQIEEPVSAVNSAHFEEELSTVVRTKRKRCTDALNEVVLSTEACSDRPAKRYALSAN